MSDVARVAVDETASPSEVDAVTRILRDADIAIPVRADWRKPPIGNGAFWAIAIVLGVPVIQFLRSFGETLGEEAGESAAAALRRFFARLRAARGREAGHGLVMLDGSDQRRIIVGDDDEAAFEALLRIDWAHVPAGTLSWDPVSERWIVEGDPWFEHGSGYEQRRSPL